MVGPEALAACCIPMLYDGGGLREIVRPGRDGFLWRTIEDLVRCTLAVARDPALRKRLASEGPGRAEQFSRERFARQFSQAVAPLVG
jgi:glycosyltransferase involved in cell wall biosynthesis